MRTAERSTSGRGFVNEGKHKWRKVFVNKGEVQLPEGGEE